jgi:hypothetical protein
MDGVLTLALESPLPKPFNSEDASVLAAVPLSSEVVTGQVARQ